MSINFNKTFKIILRKKVFSTNNAKTTRYSYRWKNWTPPLTSHCISKLIPSESKTQMWKLTTQSIQMKIQEIIFAQKLQIFLRKKPYQQNKLHQNLKLFLFKRQTTYWNNTFLMHIYDRKLISKIYIFLINILLKNIYF